MNVLVNDVPLVLPSTIGIFDSGSGGLSILQELLKHGCKNYVFFADTAHLPYGQKSPDYLLERGKVIAAFFQEREITTVIVACHTFSATVLQPLRELFPSMIFIDMLVPTLRHALQVTTHKKIGVLATSTTIASHYHRNVLTLLDSQVEVVEQACPVFVPLVEKGDEDTLECAQAIALYSQLMKHAGVDTIILGCTHYAFLMKQIAQFLPNVYVVSASFLVPYLFLFQEQQIHEKSQALGLFVVTGNVDTFALSVAQRITVKHIYSVISVDALDGRSGLVLNNSSKTPLTNL